MKNSLLFLIIFIPIQLFSQNEGDTKDIKRVIKNLYEALGNFDIEKFEESTTPNYFLIEDGYFTRNAEQVKAYYKKNNHRKRSRTDSFEFIRIEILGEIAYAIFNMNTTTIENGIEHKSKVIESVILKKISNTWKIEVIHASLKEIKQ